MKKKKKPSNSILFVSFVAIGMLVLFLGAAYIVAGSILESNAVKDEAAKGSRPVFMSDAGKPLSVSLGSITSQDVKMSLQNNINTTTICHYDIYWAWDETAEGYYTSKADSNELTISGSLSGTEMFSDVLINDFHLAQLKTKIFSGYITNTNGKLSTETWNFKVNFKTLEGVNQTKHNGKNYGGKILIEDVMCKETEFLKDVITSDKTITHENGYRYTEENVNNYVCFGSHETICPAKNLFRILVYEKDSIKLVSASTYGAGKWHDEYVAGLENSYIFYHFEKDKDIIISHEFPMIDISSESLSANDIYKLEQNAENKLKVKVGLLSYSDVKYAKWLDSYTKPYLILSESGSGISSYGHDNNVALGVSYIYPVIYIPSDVTTYIGDGSENNPYYIN